jgi:colicin import membrane protein
MRETPADTFRALLYALAFHVLALLVMIGGLWWTRTSAPLSVAGDPIEAVLVTDAGGLPPRPAAAQQDVTAAAPPPQPRPEPRPQRAETPPQPVPQQPPPRPDTRDQERAALALKQAEELARREQEERRRQEQIDLTERQKQQEEAERRERQRQQAEAREQELAEIRRQREAAERQARLEQQRLEQIRDATPTPSPQPGPSPTEPTASSRAGNRGTDESLLGQYKFAIQQAVQRNWNRPDNVRRGEMCLVEVTQIPGGEVVGHRFLRCLFDAIGRESVERAIYREPLPYSGFEKVFSRQLEIPFCYPAEDCS